jgi:hypothetical protein
LQYLKRKKGMQGNNKTNRQEKRKRETAERNFKREEKMQRGRRERRMPTG